MKTSDLIGPALDYAVAMALGLPLEEYVEHDNLYGPQWRGPEYSTDWAQGGPIVEENEIGIRRNAPCSPGRTWEASPSITAKGAGGKWGYGPSPLIAAMRCFVASRLGDQVDVPEEILK